MNRGIDPPAKGYRARKDLSQKLQIWLATKRTRWKNRRHAARRFEGTRYVSSEAVEM